MTFAMIIAIPTVLGVRRSSTTVRDPRTGADMVPSSRWGIVALSGLPLAILLLGLLILKLAS